MKKLITMDVAVSKLTDGMQIMIGGFLAAGTPNSMVKALVESGIKDLTIVCNDTSFADKGLGMLIANKQVKKVVTSHIGTNKATIEQYNNKEIEVEFVPQGTLAERIRCGGSGLGGVLTPTGVGTIAQEGKQVINLEGKDYLLETALRADVALIGASIADEEGNLFYRGTTQNFNPLMAMAANLVIAEAQEIVKTGGITMETVHTQAIFVDYVVKS
ncbi:MAG: CoA transferase subunit A [Bacteroidales bacterium]|nr:CoA transferase subunit A [Bacteroidales bacterium]MDY0141415.1 CoA transferase subunit A [Bacteroidales bacterium]